MSTRYPAAERVAVQMVLAPEVELADAIDEWTRAYAARFGHRPGNPPTGIERLGRGSA